MSDKSIFSQNLVKARKMKGWSQEGAAKSIGIKRSVLGSYEEDRAEPPHETLKKISEAYDVHDLNSFMHDPSYFEIKIEPDKFYNLYSRLPFFKRKAVDLLLGLDY
jgi:ribosome-binding protein aMBF1 (putative translation factor)